MAKHTPGPWTYNRGGFVASKTTTVCQMWGRMEEDFDNAKANARLIAAAPDMAACILHYLELCDDDGQRVYALDALRADMSVALRKAGYDVPLYESEV